MRGRKPKPDAQKALEGNPGKRRRKQDRAPLPEGGMQVPAPPRQMTKEAATEWRRLAPDLIRLGLLRRLDMSAFEARCEIYATWLRCRAVIAKEGVSYLHKGLQRQRPEVRLGQDCLRQIRQYDNEFGLTPAARARVSHVTGDGPQPRLPLGDQPQPDPSKAAPASQVPPNPASTGWSDDEFFRGPTH